MVVCSSIALMVLASEMLAVCPEGWTQPLLARRRFATPMVYDPVAQHTLVLGGTSDRTSRESWSWDGARWDILTRDGPSLMTFGAAYHSPTSKVITFGGGIPVALLPHAETWSFDNGVWTLLGTSGPPARFNAGMTLEPLSNNILMFGGWGSQGINLIPLGDTWIWNGTTWTQQPAPNPPARNDHAIATDTARGVIVMFGGEQSGNILGDTWERVGGVWTQRMVQGPSARHKHALAYDSARGVVVLAGGLNAMGQPLSDTWEWDGVAWTQRNVTGLPAISDHDMVYDAARERVLLRAGIHGSTPLDEPLLLEYDGNVWTTIFHEQPDPRTRSALAYDRVREQTIRFGGSASSGPDTRTWAWDGRDWHVAATSGPAARQRHAMTWDSTQNVVLLHGGLTHNGRNGLTDTWTWNGMTWTQVATTGPTARSSVAFAYDDARHVAVLFGGQTADGMTTLGDTWEWNGTSWSQITTTGPGPRQGALAAFDRVRQRVVLVGGIAPGDVPMTDTWEWNGTSWSQIMTSNPAPARASAMVYDEDSPSLVVIEQDTVNNIARAWTLAGLQWKLAATGNLDVRDGVLAYDAQHRKSVFVTGPDDFDSQTETWLLSIAVAADANGDGIVNNADLSVLLSQFNQSVTPGTGADFNFDGIVNNADLSVLLSNFGLNCGL